MNADTEDKMKFTQLNLLNAIYVRKPGDHAPPDVCERDEIAHPSKLLAVMNDASPWCEDVHGWTKCVKWDHQYDCGVTCHGFHVFCENPDMFQCATTMKFHDWLNKYGHLHFIISSPILSASGGLQYTHSNNPFQPRILPLSLKAHMFLPHGAYTIGCGVTIAIALHRLGMLHAHTITNALKEYDNCVQLSPIITEYYIQSSMPQVSDYPYLYASIGNSDPELLQFLWDRHHADDDPMFCTVQRGNRVIFSDKFTLSHSPNDILLAWQQHEGVGDTVTFDVGGLLRTIMTNKVHYSWWRDNHHDMLQQLCSTYSTKLAAIHHILRRAMYLYGALNSQHKSRALHVWNDLVTYFSLNDVAGWMHKYIKKLRDPSPTTWMPLPPYELIEWLLAKDLRDVVYKALQLPTACDHIITFKDGLDKKITQRLLLMKSMFIGDTSPCWHPMEAFLMSNMHYLYV